jgi:hypothetical protein
MLTYHVNRKIVGLQMELWTTEGRMIQSQAVPHENGVHQFPISVSNLDSGVYFLMLRSSQGETVSNLKLVVR